MPYIRGPFSSAVGSAIVNNDVLLTRDRYGNGADPVGGGHSVPSEGPGGRLDDLATG